MPKIALIDTYVNPRYIKNGTVRHIKLLQGEEHDDESISHGTLCAMLIDCCTSDYDLINIQILPDAGTRKSFGSIDNLAEALDMCIELDIDIISMSAVTSLLSDSKLIYAKAKRLSEKTVIVGALDNAKYITVPTSYPFVIGVQNDGDNCLTPGEIAYKHDEIFGTDLYANCDFEFLDDMGFVPSNSFAVPVAVAYINNLMKIENLTPEFVWEILRSLPEYPTVTGSFEKAVTMKKTMASAEGRINLPCVYIRAEGNRLCRDIMDWMLEEEDVQSCAVMAGVGEYDVRFAQYENNVPLPEQIQYMWLFYKTDIIFVCDGGVLEDGLNSAEYDVAMICIDGNVKILYDGTENVVPYESAARELYRILDTDED